MVNSESDNDHTRHNERITPRPAILIPATGVGNDGQIRQMGKSGPRFVAASFPLAGKDDLPGYADWGLEPIEYVREFNGRYLSLNSVERRGAGDADHEGGPGYPAWSTSIACDYS